MNRTFTVAIGGAAGQGVATPGDIFARIFAPRRLHINRLSETAGQLFSQNARVTRTTFGPNTLESFRVWTDEVSAGQITEAGA